MDKFTNLVSTDPPLDEVSPRPFPVSAATFIILLCYFREDFYDFSMHLEFPLWRFLYDLMTAIKTLERSEVDWILFDLLKSTINWFNVVICIHSILTIVFFCVFLFHTIPYLKVAKNISKCSSVLEKIPVKLFTCILKSKQALGQQLLEHYKVTPVFEAETGRYACQIDLKTAFNEILSIVKTNDIHFELEVSFISIL